MWSSSEPAPQGTDSQAQTYVYPPPQAPGGAKPPPRPGGPSTLESLWVAEARPAAPAAPNEEQVRAREARARQEGKEQAEAELRVEYEKKLAAERAALAQAIRQFAHEQETYFAHVESEVVRLALAIARKILHREAQVDPLLLAGVVRIGLDKVEAGTRVRLRVHPDQIATWQQFFAQQPDVQPVPELMGDATLGAGHCLLETELGSSDLTLETQLKEIEQGFFDLLAQRP